MTVKFYLERNKTVSKHKTIYAYVHEKGKGIFIHTNEKINIAYWDKSAQRANLRKTKNHILQSELKMLNQYLDAFQNKIFAIIRNIRIENPTEDLDSIFGALKKHFSSSKTSFFDSYAEYISLKKITLSSEAIQKQQRTMNLLRDFEKRGKMQISFKNINATFLEKFLVYLIKDNDMINNTANKTISFFKTFLIWANKNGLTDNTAYNTFKLKYEENEVIYLTENELMNLYSFQSDNERLKRVRDIFCFQCFTGVRYSDIENIRWENIKNNIWYLRTQKTKNVLEIPLNGFAVSIISKYSDHPNPLPVISNQRMNQYLKELCNEAGIDEPITIVKYQANERIEKVKKKYELVGSHTARRTFITLSIEKGMKPEVIMSITGHKSYKMMQKYLKIADKHKRNEMDKTWGSPLRKIK